MSGRYDRQIRMFGPEGQARIGRSHAVVLGLGGLGMPLLQQLAYLGVRRYSIADSDIVTESSLNRLVGAFIGDLGGRKVDVAERTIRMIQPNAEITTMNVEVPDEAISAAVGDASVVIGCFDRETPRLIVTQICSVFGVPYVDVASEVVPTETGPVFGGRVVCAKGGEGCVSCLEALDPKELARERMTEAQRRVDDLIYGVQRDALDGSGPSVVTLNSVVVSLAAMEIMCLLTGVREPARQLTYRGDLGTVTRRNDRGRDDCPYCSKWRTAA